MRSSIPLQQPFDMKYHIPQQQYYPNMYQYNSTMIQYPNMYQYNPMMSQYNPMMNHFPINFTR